MNQILLNMRTGIIALIAFLCSVTYAAAYEIGLKEAVSVSSDVIYVHDVVTHLSGEDLDSALREQILNTVLSKTPQPGKHRQLTRSYIVMKIKNNNINIQGASFSGASAVFAERSCQLLSESKIKEMVTEYIHNMFGVSAETIRINFGKDVKDLYVPSGTCSFNIHVASEAHKQGKLGIAMDIFINESYYRQEIISVNIEEKVNAMIAVQQIAPGTVIQDEDIIQAECFVERGMEFFDNDAVVKGKVAKKLIREGEIVQKRWLEDLPLVRKGESVSGIIEHKNMQVVMRVNALEDGSKGETIKVYNPDTKTHLIGKVIALNTVEILF